MPTKFNTSGEGRRVDLDPVIPVDAAYVNPEDYADTSMAEALTTVGSVLDEVSKGRAQAANDAALAQYSSASSDIIGQTEGYSKERERILQGLAAADPKDQQALNAYYTQLSRLRRGEVQGALSPSAAQAKLNTLTKSYINRYPSLAQDIRKLHSGLANDVPNVAGATGREVDPDIAALEALTKTATERGWSVQEVIAFNNAQARDVAQNLELEAKKRTGTLRQADISNSVNSYLNTTYKALPESLREPGATSILEG